MCPDLALIQLETKLSILEPDTDTYRVLGSYLDVSV